MTMLGHFSIAFQQLRRNVGFASNLLHIYIRILFVLY